MSRLPGFRHPRGRVPGLPGRHPVEWARLVAIAALLGVLSVAGWKQVTNSRPNSSVAAQNAGAFSAISNGYDGLPIRIGVEGPRSKAFEGACLVIVRDGSSSVSSAIDPDEQVNKELASVAEAFIEDGVSADRIGAVTFAARAQSSGLRSQEPEDVRSVLIGGSGEDGTSITAGLGAAADALAECPAGAQRHVLLVTDGASSAEDIGEGLSALSDDTSLHLIALDEGGWASRAPMWGSAAATATVVRRLDAGVVALAANRVLSNITGQNFTTGFDATGGTQ